MYSTLSNESSEELEDLTTLYAPYPNETDDTEPETEPEEEPMEEPIEESVENPMV